MDELSPVRPATDLADLLDAGENLEAGQYEQMADVLRDAQLACERSGDVVSARILASARSVCLACGQCQAEARWHDEAGEEAGRRVRRLRRQLQALLHLIIDPALSDAPGSPEGPSALPPVTVGQSERGPPRPEPAIKLHQRLWKLWTRILRPELRRKKLADDAAPSPALMPDVDAETFSAYPARLPGAQALSSPQQKDPLAAPRDVAVSPAPDSTAEETEVPVPVAEETTDSQIVRPAVPAVSEEATAPAIAVHCLGQFRVFQDDQPVTDWPSSKGKAIFKYLVTHRHSPVAKEVLMDLFWPGAHPDAARNSLNVAIYGLRQALRKAHPVFSHVLFENDCYLLNRDLDIWIDVEEFNDHLRTARDLDERGELSAAVREYHAAEALYQGDFLEEDRYESWLTSLRQSLQANQLNLLECLSRYYLERDDHMACTILCRKMLALDACCEEAHRRLMRCYSTQGQHYMALRQFHVCVESLRQELDVAPAPATTQLARARPPPRAALASRLSQVNPECVPTKRSDSGS